MDEYHYKTLKEISENHIISQRQLAKRMEMSLGKANYIINALIDKGLIKVKSFKNSKNKLGYMYILTPKGMTKKMELTYEFLKRKMAEYERLEKEIEKLKTDINKAN